VKEGVANNGVMEKQAQASNKACGCGNSVANAAVIELHAPTSSTQKLKLLGRRWAIHLYSNSSNGWHLGARVWSLSRFVPVS